MYHKYTGIILKKHPLGEADELLTVFTKEIGKLRVKAISTRKIRSRLGGHMQSLNEIEFETAGRAGSSGPPVVVSVRAISVNSYLRENLKKFAYALIGAETLYRLAPDRQENFEAYAVLQNFLKELGNSLQENLCLRRFQVQLLQIMGFGFDTNEIDAAPLKASELKALTEGQSAQSMSPDMERTIDRFVNYVLEREIKSTKFLDSLI